MLDLGASVACLIVDDAPSSINDTLRFLSNLEGFRAVGSAGSLKEAIASGVPPDLVLLDLSLPETKDGMSPGHMVKVVRETWPHGRVLVVTSSIKREDAIEVMNAGAIGYVIKETPNFYSEFEEALRAAAAGVIYMTPSLAGYWLKEDEDRPDKALTPAQRDVLELFATGLRPREIARRLDITDKTVNSHLEDIRERLGGYLTPVELSRFAQAYGIVEPPSRGEFWRGRAAAVRPFIAKALRRHRAR